MSSNLTISRCWIWGGALLAGALAAAGAGTNAASSDVLLLDSLGRLVQEPASELPSQLHPPAAIGFQGQVPEPTRGSMMPQEILQRTRENATRFEFFPAFPPPLMPYLASQDEFGNTAIHPGALLPVFPLEPLIQGAKYRLSQIGLRYSLDQTLTLVSMTDVMKGDNTLGYYTLDFRSKWAIFSAPAAGAGGSISSQVEAKTGFGSASENQSARSNLGTVTDPTGIWSSVNGVRAPEFAWQQSLADGRVVVVAGVVNQRNYIDQNAYAQSGRKQFLNSALIDSMVLPLGAYNFGLNLQWQPVNEAYGMLGGNVGHARAGYTPWTDFVGDDWSLLWEFGYAPADVAGLGPGIYRAQPFVAASNGTTQGGLCFDLQQKLGSASPFGWFGRFGFGGSEVSAGASAQIGTGFVMQGPLKHLLVQRTSNDLLGLGFVWSQPSATSQPVVHRNEYVWETVYVMQLSSTMKLQPDFQLVWNPAHNPNTHVATVFQLQFAMTW
jgi:hypothetical protein